MDHEAFLDELIKIAKTRMAREAEKALAAGDMDYLKQLGGAAEGLGLKPRQVADVSKGGMEGGVDLMIGKRKGLKGGLIARKLYDPESLITRGQVTTELLERKQKATDAMREAAQRLGGKVDVPAMGGFDVLHADKGPGMARHVSYHEFKPGLKEMKGGAAGGIFRGEGMKGAWEQMKKNKIRAALGGMPGLFTGVGEASQRAAAPLEETSKVLREAGKKTKMTIGDAVIGRLPFGLGHIMNPGNVQMTPEGKAAIVDVIPGDNKFFQRMAEQQQAAGAPRLGLGMGDERNLAATRREIFSPTAKVRGRARFGQLSGLSGMLRSALRPSRFFR